LWRYRKPTSGIDCARNRSNGRGLRRAESTLRMFDRSELATNGMITISVQHPKTKCKYTLDFYVAANHRQPILGFQACRKLNLLKVVQENIYEIHAGLNESKRAGPPSSVIAGTTLSDCLTEAAILSEYADLFDGVGLLEAKYIWKTTVTRVQTNFHGN